MPQMKTYLLDKDNHYKDLFEYSNDAIILHSLKGEIMMANPRAKMIFGWKDEALTALNIYNLFSCKEQCKVDSLRECLIENRCERIDCHLMKMNHTTFPVEVSFSLMELDGHEVVQAIIRDLTAEKETLSMIKKTNNELNRKKQDLVEAQRIAHIGNWEYDVLTNTITWADEIYRIFEFDPNEFEANYEAFLGAIHPDDVARVNAAYMQSINSKEPYHEIFRLLTSKGIKHVEDRCKHIMDDKGNIIRSIGLIQDITEFVEKEEQIKHQEEMIIVQSRHAAMGEMIGMIAHQWRQPISVVGLLTETVKHSLRADPIKLDLIEGDLEQIGSQIHYMSNTIEDFKNFFQKSDKADEVMLHTLLNEVKTMLGAVLKQYEIEIIIQCDASISLYTYGRELLQVVMNIVTNAKDVLKKQEGIKEVLIDVYQIGEEIEIVIFNNGTHIDEAIKKKIFEPYFTTKSNSGGTGLGLYMVKTIVDKHIQGNIAVENVEDGVEFRIVLPKRLEEA